jgi:hypothetical protein
MRGKGRTASKKVSSPPAKSVWRVHVGMPPSPNAENANVAPAVAATSHSLIGTRLDAFRSMTDLLPEAVMTDG